MANSNKVDSNTIFKALDVIINKRIEDLDLDKTVVATIEKPLYPARDGSHRVKYNTGVFTAYAPVGTVYAPNTTVYVLIPQGDFSKKKNILGTASSYYVGNTTQAVSSALNDYSIVGSNTLTLIDEDFRANGVGLNSYTLDSDGDSYQDIVVLYDRKNIVDSYYKLNIPQLETYIKEAKAVMLSADFRTCLDEVQQTQAAAEYGLIFSLIFNNQNTIYSTNGELFNSVSENVKSYQGDHLISMSRLQENIETTLNNSELDVSSIIAEINDNIYPTMLEFLEANAGNFTAQETAIFTAYKNLIVNLLIGNFETINSLKEEYYNWFDESLATIQTDINQPTKTLSYVLSSSSMSGNPFLFTGFSNQYEIFPIDKENFIGIDNIIFYCKGFQQDATKWQYIDKIKPKMQERNGEYHGKDIWVKNVQFLALKEISSEYGDYRISVTTPNGAIFYGVTDEDKVTAAAKVRYKEWTSINDSCTFYWFKKDIRVSSTQHPNYDMRGGLGWYHLGTTSTGHESTRTFVGSDNMAYENFYLCVAEYNDGNGPIYLKEYFTLYNEACKRNITIESDIGTKFKFDNGVPTLTCLIDGRSSYFDTDIVIEDNSEENESEVVVPENKDELFKFYWSKRNTSGLVVNFIEGNEEPGVSVDKNILSYPIKNVQNASQVFFECQVYKVDDADDIEHSEKWYCIGTGSITLYNEDTKTINEFTVKIDNDTQVFQYSETGVSPLFATTITPTNFRHTEPIEILPLRAHLYDPTGLEVSEGRYTVSWRFPIQNTLITPPADLYENVLTEEFDQIDGQTTEFSIAQYYDYNCTNNQIQCIVNFGGEAYSAYTDFYFGKIGDNGTNGTDYVAKIIITDENDHTHSLDTQPLTVYEYIENEEKEAVWNSHYLQNSDDPILEVQLYNRGTLVDPSDYTFVKWDILGGIGRSKYWTFEEVTEEQDGQTYTLQHKIKLHYNPNKNGTYINQLVKATILFKNREYHCVYPVCIVQIDGSINDLESELYPDETGKNLLYIDNSKYLKQILYNSDGRTPMYNKNQGVFIHGLQGRATTWQIVGGLESQDISDIPIRLLEEKDSITGVSELSTTNVDGVYILPSDEYNGISCDNRVEITSYSSEEIAEWITQEVPAAIQVAKEQYEQDLKDIKDNIRQEKVDYRNLQIQCELEYREKTEWAYEQYKENLETLEEALTTINEWYSSRQEEITTYYNDQINSLNIESNNALNTYNTTITNLQNEINNKDPNKVKQIKILVPIYMSLNVYGLASLNAWDGNSIDINEEDGYIIAPQIGAGAKDKDDQGHELNTFTGIVMGEMSAYGEEDSDIGLLGLSQGRQSIFLDAKTGSAYFGLPETDKFGGSGEEGYTEGRIELKPGDVSTIGGWHLGRRSLFYAQNAALDSSTVVTINGTDYGVGDVLPDLGPGNIDYGKSSTTHEKDIGHTDSGILLAANNLQNGELNNKPYISLKGKPLTVGTGSSFDIDDTTGNNVLLNGDSLELQLDPNQSSLFTIYRHYRNNGEWTRYPMVGINSEGRFYSNALQDQETSLSLNYVGGFGWTAAQQKYIGLNITASQKTIFKAILDTKAFLGNAKEKDYPLRITGSNGSNEYNRPISLHGRNINLYAVTQNTNYPQIPDPEHPDDPNHEWYHADVPLTTNSKISISEDLGFIGTDATYEEVEPNSFISENAWYELSWIYELTEDTEVVNNKTYYNLENEEYIEIIEIAENANPQEENWYEKIATYTRTQDSELDLEKDYYYNDNGEYKIVYNNFTVPDNWFIYNESYDVYSRAGGTILTKTMYYTKSGGHYLRILSANSNTLSSDFTVTNNNVDFNFGKNHRVKIDGIYNFNSGGNWTTNIAGTANFNAAETITSISNSNQNIYANHNNNSFASLLEMSSTQVALGYSNLLNNEKSHIILTPKNGSAWYSHGIMSVDVNGKININQENANEGINIVSANGDAEGTEKGRVYLTIRPNSGTTKNLTDNLSTYPNAPYQQVNNFPENANPKELDWYQYINGQYVKTEDEVVTQGHVYFTNWNDFPQFNLTTNDNAFIRHQWCINPNQNTIQNSAGWAIKPGIQTDWLKIGDDSHKLFFNNHSISGTGAEEGISNTITITGNNLYDLLQAILNKLAYVEQYSANIWTHFKAHTHNMNASRYVSANEIGAQGYVTNHTYNYNQYNNYGGTNMIQSAGQGSSSSASSLNTDPTQTTVIRIFTGDSYDVGVSGGSTVSFNGQTTTPNY